MLRSREDKKGELSSKAMVKLIHEREPLTLLRVTGIPPPSELPGIWRFHQPASQSLGTTAVPDRKKPVTTLASMHRPLIFAGSLHTVLQASQPSPFYRLGKWGSQRLSPCPRSRAMEVSVTVQGSNKGLLWVGWGQSPCSCLPKILPHEPSALHHCTSVPDLCDQSGHRGLNLPTA